MINFLLENHDKLCVRTSTPSTFTLLNWPDDERRLKIPFSRVEMIQINSLEGHYVETPAVILMLDRPALEVYDMEHRIKSGDGSDVKRMIQHFTWWADQERT